MTAKKGLMYGGGTLASVLILRWLWRRRSGALGASYTLIRAATAAGSQVAKATVGSRLTDYRSAEDHTMFGELPTSNGEAYHFAAYWMAVASRLTGSSSLAAAAGAALAKGNLLGSVPGASHLTGSVREILADAAGRVRTAGGNNRQAAAVAKLLSPQAGAIATAQKAREEASASGIAKGTAKASADDVSSLLTTAGEAVATLAKGGRAMLGLNNPDGSAPSSFAKWGLRVGLVAAVALVLRIKYAGHYHAARAIAADTLARAKAPAPA